MNAACQDWLLRYMSVLITVKKQYNVSEVTLSKEKQLLLQLIKCFVCYITSIKITKFNL